MSAKTSRPVVLGVDPGSAITGFGLVELSGTTYLPLDFGCIRPPPKLKISLRRQAIFEGLCHLMDQHLPVAVAVETQFVHRNVRTAMLLGMVRGITILAATQRNIPIFEYTPSKAKKAVSGNGAASKQQVQRMVQYLLGIKEPIKSEDAADALSLAICHLNACRGDLLGQEL